MEFLQHLSLKEEKSRKKGKSDLRSWLKVVFLVLVQGCLVLIQIDREINALKAAIQSCGSVIAHSWFIMSVDSFVKLLLGKLFGIRKKLKWPLLLASLFQMRLYCWLFGFFRKPFERGTSVWEHWSGVQLLLACFIAQCSSLLHLISRLAICIGLQKKSKIQSNLQLDSKYRKNIYQQI